MVRDSSSDLQPKSSIAIIILAAGASRRMGQPKQLLPYRGQTLLSYVAQCAISSDCNPVIVILGANAPQIEPAIATLPVQIVINHQWHQGISSSIRCGISYLERQLITIEGVVFLTCDQPFVTAEIIDQLIDTHNIKPQSIIASHYQAILGIPALFPRSLFPELIKLQGDRGAKKIINQYPELVDPIDFPQGEIDLDTFAQYQQLLKSN